MDENTPKGEDAQKVLGMTEYIDDHEFRTNADCTPESDCLDENTPVVEVAQTFLDMIGDVHNFFRAEDASKPKSLENLTRVHVPVHHERPEVQISSTVDETLTFKGPQYKAQSILMLDFGKVDVLEDPGNSSSGAGSELRTFERRRIKNQSIIVTGETQISHGFNKVEVPSHLQQSSNTVEVFSHSQPGFADTSDHDDIQTFKTSSFKSPALKAQGARDSESEVVFMKQHIEDSLSVSARIAASFFESLQKKFEHKEETFERIKNIVLLYTDGRLSADQMFKGLIDHLHGHADLIRALKAFFPSRSNLIDAVAQSEEL